jgi:hypothetical protein
LHDVDQVIAEVERSLPNVRWSQLTAKHPADDDGIWFFNLPSGRNGVQIESSSGNCPFLIEHDATHDRFHGATPSEVAKKVVELLQF